MMAGFMSKGMLRRCILVAACIAGGGLFGLSISLIPSPHEVKVFWVSNLATPWLVLAFLAGWSQRSWIWSAVAGVMVNVASIIGFYGRFLFIDQHPLQLPLNRPTPMWVRLENNLNHWLHFITPWVMIAILAGMTYGVLGYWWRRHRSIVAGTLVGLPFIAEPWLWRVYLGYYKDPLILWITEVAVGIAVLVCVIISWNTFQKRNRKKKRR